MKHMVRNERPLTTKKSIHSKRCPNLCIIPCWDQTAGIVELWYPIILELKAMTWWVWRDIFVQREIYEVDIQTQWAWQSLFFTISIFSNWSRLTHTHLPMSWFLNIQKWYGMSLILYQQLMRMKRYQCLGSEIRFPTYTCKSWCYLTAWVKSLWVSLLGSFIIIFLSDGEISIFVMAQRFFIHLMLTEVPLPSLLAWWWGQVYCSLCQELPSGANVVTKRLRLDYYWSLAYCGKVFVDRTWSSHKRFLFRGKWPNPTRMVVSIETLLFLAIQLDADHFSVRRFFVRAKQTHLVK